MTFLEKRQFKNLQQFYWFLTFYDFKLTKTIEMPPPFLTFYVCVRIQDIFITFRRVRKIAKGTINFVRYVRLSVHPFE
jgi:hypothetical protein